MASTNTQSIHSSLHLGMRIRTSCPSSHLPVYGRDDARGRTQLDVPRFVRRLHRLNVRPGSPIMRNAAAFADALDMIPEELLHLAIERAVRPNTSRPNIKLIPFLTMLMRSIASSIHRARARARERGNTIPLDYVAEQVPDTRTIVDPAQTLDRRDDRALYERLLGQVTGGDPMLERLVDQIGFGHRGEVIARELEIEIGELASLRRKLKRRAKAVLGVAGPITIVQAFGAGETTRRR